MSNIFFLFWHVGIGSFAFSMLWFRGQKLRRRSKLELHVLPMSQYARMDNWRDPKYSSLQANPNDQEDSNCQCTPSSPYRFMNMWEIISQSSNASLTQQQGN